MSILRMILALLRAFFASRANLAAENAMLRQQLIVLQRSAPRLKLGRTDRVLLCWLSRLWTGWRSALLIVQTETIVRWYRQGFKLYWSWKSRKKQGRPLVQPGDSRSDSPHVPGESHLGRPEDPIRAGSVGPQRGRVHGEQVHVPPAQAAVTELAKFPAEPCQPICSHRLFHGAHDYLQNTLRLLGLAA